MTIGPERLDFLRKNSKIRLDKEGRWSMDGRPVEHPRVQRLFHRGVVPVQDRYQLHVGDQWCWIQFLEDTAYFVERARLEEGGVSLVLADERVEALDPTSLSSTGREDLYCVLENGHRARFLRDAMNALSPGLEERDGRLGLQVGGEFFEIQAE